MNITVEGKDIVVRIPYDEAALTTAPMTSSGHSRMLATTKGFVPVLNGMPDNVKVAVNLIAVLPKDERRKA